MRRLRPFVFFALLAGIGLISSSTSPAPYYEYTPYFMERSELHKSVFYTDGQRDMKEPGKIWVRGDEIFVVERYKGVHIIDNSDPEDPVQTGFIVAPGCMDVAVRDNMIYLDNAVDLVAFDMTTKKVTARIKDHFPEPASPAGNNGYYYHSHPSHLVIVGWTKTTPKYE